MIVFLYSFYYTIRTLIIDSIIEDDVIIIDVKIEDVTVTDFDVTSYDFDVLFLNSFFNSHLTSSIIRRENFENNKIDIFDPLDSYYN